MLIANYAMYTKNHSIINLGSTKIIICGNIMLVKHITNISQTLIVVVYKNQRLVGTLMSKWIYTAYYGNENNNSTIWNDHMICGCYTSHNIPFYNIERDDELILSIYGFRVSQYYNDYCHYIYKINANIYNNALQI